MLRSSAYLPAFALVLAACTDRPQITEPESSAATAVAAVQGRGQATGAAYWNEVARSLVATNNSNALVAIRAYAIVSLAQYQAAVAADKNHLRRRHASVPAAIGAASVVVLSYLYPGAAATLEARLDEVLAGNRKRGDEDAGEAIGREVAAAVVARAQNDNFFAPFTGTVPTGPGIWSSANPPVGAALGEAKTFFLRSGSQFRPPTPPQFGSPAFLEALAEVREIADTRTAEQTELAVFWNLPAGTHQPPGYWNVEAVRLAKRYRLRERETAHLLALLNMVAYDALVASHEAKYFYWLLRPSHADPAITLPIGLPNFPSYPSNHAAISAGMARVLGTRFPAERRRLDRLAEEAALSRVYGGIHYRFDGEAGLVLGRRVAAWAISRVVTR